MTPNNPTPTSLTPSDPLAALHDIHLPPPVSAWPPAPGWWGLSALLLVSVIALIVFGKRRWQRRAYRRQALRDLRSAFAQYQADAGSDIETSKARFQQHTLRLLKQTALVAYPHAEVANLHGTRWLQFLDRPLRKPVFNQPELQPLAHTYAAEAKVVDAQPLYDAARLWIRKH